VEVIPGNEYPDTCKKCGKLRRKVLNKRIINLSLDGKNLYG
jgi:hypothetical protein